jgi:hypothetical protein
MSSKLQFSIACLAACIGLSACYIPPMRVQGHPIGGHMDAELARSADGIIAIWEDRDRLEVVDLATQRKTSIPIPPGALAVSGPAWDGTVAVVREGQDTDTARLISVIGPNPREIRVEGVTRSEQVRIALSPSGQRLAVLLGHHRLAPLEQLRVYSTRDGSMELSVDDSFVGSPPVWIDESRLVYQTNDNPGQSPTHAGVTSLDVANGDRRLLPSATQLARGREGQTYLTLRGPVIQESSLDDAVSGSYEFLPGFMRNGLLGITPDGHLLYEAWSSESETTETFARSMFSLMGPSERWTVKISDGVSGAYATVVDMIGGTVEYRGASR